MGFASSLARSLVVNDDREVGRKVRRIAGIADQARHARAAAMACVRALAEKFIGLIGVIFTNPACVVASRAGLFHDPRLFDQRPVPGLGDPHPHDFARVPASHDALDARRCEPGAHEIGELVDAEPVRDHERFGHAIAARGQELERAAAIGLGDMAGGSRPDRHRLPPLLAHALAQPSC
jgi:hypothetical protein